MGPYLVSAWKGANASQTFDPASIRTAFAERAIVGLALVAAVGISISLLRGFINGWQGIYTTQILLALWILTFAVFRKSMPDWLKTIGIATPLIVLGAASLIRYGVLSGGSSFFVIAGLIIGYFMGFRAVVIYAIGLSTFIAGIAWLFITQHLVPASETAGYAYTAANWGVVIVADVVFLLWFSAVASWEGAQVSKGIGVLSDIVNGLDNASDGIAICQPDDTIIYCNTVFAEMAGLPSSRAARGRHILSLFRGASEKDRDLSILARKTRQETGTGACEVTLINAQNTSITLDARSNVFGDGRYIVMFKNVTAERAREQRAFRLASAGARLTTNVHLVTGNTRALLAELTTQVAAALNVERVVVWNLNPEGDALTLNTLHDDRAAESSQESTLHFQGNETFFAAIRYLRHLNVPDVRTFESSMALVDTYCRPQDVRAMFGVPINRGGLITGVLCAENRGEPRGWTPEEIAYAIQAADVIALAMEVEARLKSEKSLREVAQSLSMVVEALDSSNDIIVLTERDGTVAYANESLRKTFGVRQSPIMGEKLATAVPHFADHQPEPYAASSRENADRWEKDVLVEDEHGKTNIINLHATRRPVGGWIYNGTNITEMRARAQAEADLRSQLCEARKMETVGRLAGGIAHDLNNMLGAINNFAGLLTMNLPKDGADHTYAERISTLCERGADFVGEILTFSRSSNAPRKAVNLTDIINESLILIEPRLGNRTSLKTTFKANCPAVTANTAQMVQVIMNLGINAADAIADNTGTVVIETSTVTFTDIEARALLEKTMARGKIRAGTDLHFHVAVQGSVKANIPYVAVRVRDNGPGMTVEVLARAFEPFFSTKMGRGSGLGLATVASIIQAHGGALDMTTAPGLGTRVDVYLPLETYLVPDMPHGPQEFGEHGTERILIIEHNVDYADGMASGLSALGYEAAPLYDAAEALTAFQEEPKAWDVVVAASSMPTATALTLTEALKALNRDVRIIVLTSSLNEEKAAKAMAAGVSRILQKPVTIDILSREIRTLMEQPKQKTELADDAYCRDFSMAYSSAL